MTEHEVKRGMYECLTVDPNNPAGPRIEAFIPLDRARQIFKTNPIKFEHLRCVKQILEHPLHIYEGIRDKMEGGWCYVGRPLEWAIKEGVIAPFPQDKVFAVYLRSNMTVFDWQAEQTEEGESSCPKDWRQRYRRRVWSITS